MRVTGPDELRRRRRGRLVLQDGAVFPGAVFGAPRPAAGEVVFTTGMVGYPEALTEPSYRGQILVFTYPSQGNYGVPRPPLSDPATSGRTDDLPDRPFESSRVHLSGVVCASYSETYSHRTAAVSLGDWLAGQGVPALTGIDTRALTKKIRMHGALLGRIEIDGRPSPEFDDPNRRNLVEEVSTRGVERHGKGGVPVVLIDCGRKSNQVRMLVRLGAEPGLVPIWNWQHNGVAVHRQARSVHNDQTEAQQS